MKFFTKAALASLLLTPLSTFAGTEIEAAGKDKIIAPEEKTMPYGMLTLGYKFSDDLQSGYLDSLTPFWDPGDFVFFFNTRTTIDDSGQSIGSYGLGARYLVPGHDIILGANAYYDSLHSGFGNDFDQLGLGVELLTHWFDARVNWYVPDNGIYETGRFSTTENDSNVSAPFQTNGLIKQRVSSTSHKSYYKTYEGGVEGFNMEAGFLIPGLDKYAEVRVLAGYYNYDGPFDKHYDGFKARLEARFLPGLIGDVEYWDDAELTGGHWIGEIRATIPFTIGNLFTGRNPFEGAGEMFTPRKREFRERLSEQVIRSHRVMTSNSGPRSSGSSTKNKTFDQTIGPAPTQTPAVRQSSPGGGGGGGDTPPPTTPPETTPPQTTPPTTPFPT